MTIEDAIRRAKILGQSRMQREKSGDAHPGRSPEPRPVADERYSAPRPVAPAMHFEPLKSVEISADACAQYRVLLIDTQLREFAAADAAYRLLRSRLQNRLKKSNWFSLAIASPNSGDGKTVTALNLAISIAREKQRPVYLLDLDMRNPSVCRFLGIQDIRPLPDYFLGHARPEEVLFETSFPNLIVAGAVGPTEGASEMLAGPRFSDLLAHIRLRSPDAFVLVDAPPVTLTDEALLIGPRVDGFLVVVSEGKTERKDLSQTLTTLGEFTVAGVVINRSSDGQTTGYGHYSAYAPA
jgi:capsular exopolysaccharide synthesis family protein